jgi:5'-3' exonuclease
MAKTLLLIDGDQYLYRSCAACEKDVRWDEENHVLTANEADVWDTLMGAFNNIFDHFGTKDHVMAMGEAPYFRHVIDPNYKPGRGRKPLCFYDIRERMRGEFNVVTMPTLEADDVMGILSTKPGPVEKIIIARDKDMQTIPGKLWDGLKFQVVTEAAADRFHMYQTLVGDTADGYKGCPGVGDVAAMEFLDEPYVLVPVEHELKSGKRKGEKEVRFVKEPMGDRSLWAGVVSLFAKAGLAEADALRQAQLARILRWQDWNSVTKTPILWEPK